MKVFLTRRASKNYRSIKEYIAHEWGEKVAEAFEQKTIGFSDVLEDFPEIGIEGTDKQKGSGVPTHQADASILSN